MRRGGTLLWLPVTPLYVFEGFNVNLDCYCCFKEDRHDDTWTVPFLWLFYGLRGIAQRQAAYIILHVCMHELRPSFAPSTPA